jgi:alkylated DNA repair protein alkB family protein 1
MPVHRDVSEECERGLASISLGCDGLFIIAREMEDQCEPDLPHSPEESMLILRVRSGDVVQMGGATRWAWHAMPKVMAGTCPYELQDWPVRDGAGTPKEYERWKGFMHGKR